MKKLAPAKQAEVMKHMFTHVVILAERQKPKKSSKQKVAKFGWFAGECPSELNDKAVEKMVQKQWIEADSAGGYVLTEEGRAVAEMMVGQKVFDFTTGMFVPVKCYDEDPLHKPNLPGFHDKPAELGSVGAAFEAAAEATRNTE